MRKRNPLQSALPFSGNPAVDSLQDSQEFAQAKLVAGIIGPGLAGAAERGIASGVGRFSNWYFNTSETGAIGTTFHSVYKDGTLVLQGQQPPRLGAANPLPEAQGAHSVLRIDTVNNRIYQGRTFDSSGKPILDIDFTVPVFPNGRPRPNHNFGEIHPWFPHSGGFKRGKAWSPF